MKRRLALVTTVTAALFTAALLTPSATAQNARANVPFEFSANHQTLPAGCYKVTLQSESALALVSCKTGKVAVMMVRTAEANQTVTRGSLEFYNSGHKYWLTAVRFAYVNMESELAAQPKPELTLAKKADQRMVEVAMK